jgi:hypothetical protein
LDRLVAPELSKLTVCSAPDIPEPPDYFASYFLNNALNFPLPEEMHPVLVTFLRRWSVAVREYRAGREHLSKFVVDLPRTNNQTSLFLSALAHFEHSVANAYLALMALGVVSRVFGGKGSAKPFVKDDGTHAWRLNELTNAIKHFDEQVENHGHVAYPAPVWLTNVGLKCHRPQGAGQQKEIVLAFSELAQLLNDLTEDARVISEEVHRLIEIHRAEDPT